MAVSSLTIRPRRTAAAKQGKKLWVEPWVVWRRDAYRELACPACGERSVMEKHLDASPPFDPRKRYALYACGPCGTLHYPDAPAFEYESRKEADIARKFYVEIGAGLDAMIAPLAWAEPERVKSYLEVGGGYGFSVDFAARGLGWRSANIDPSFIARTGAADLGHKHLPEYLSAENPLPDGPFDRVLSSEVIEHVSNPDPFLAALVSALGEDGALIITTPDAGAVHPGASLDAMRLIIAAGHHLVIFSAKGLEAALRRAGMAHVSVIARDQTLYAVAARKPVEVDFTARPDREVFRKYLKARRDALSEDPTLHAGFAVRLLKESVHAGAWDEAREALENLSARWRQDYGLDLGAPQSIRPTFVLPEKKRFRAIRAFAANHCYNLAVALFYAARLKEQDGDLDKAEALYRACARSAKTLRKVFAAIFAACRETEDAGHRAALHAAMLAVRSDPKGAAREILALMPDAADLPQDLWHEAQCRVFADGVLTGRGDAVEPLALMVQALLLSELNTREALTPTQGYAAGALGIKAEQAGRVDDAARWYDHAAAAMTDASERKVFESNRDRVARPAPDPTDAIEAAYAEITALEAEGRSWKAKRKALALLDPDRPDHNSVVATLGSRLASLEHYRTS